MTTTRTRLEQTRRLNHQQRLLISVQDQRRINTGTVENLKSVNNALEKAYLELLASGRRKSAKAMTPRSVEVIHKTIKAAYALAVRRGQVATNPADLATPPSVATQARMWWTPEQVGRFLAHVALEPLVVVGLGEMLVDSGGRRGEVLGLRWLDIDLDDGTARVVQQLVADPTTKALSLRPTKRARSKSVIGLHPGTMAVLKRRRKDQAADRLAIGNGWPTAGTVAHDLVFTWPDGRPIHPDVLTRTVQRTAGALGLPRIGPHGLRHSFATAALSAHVPVEVVAFRLGNTPRVVQEVYQHVIPADDAAAARQVGDLFRRKGQA